MPIFCSLTSNDNANYSMCVRIHIYVCVCVHVCVCVCMCKYVYYESCLPSTGLRYQECMAPLVSILLSLIYDCTFFHLYGSLYSFLGASTSTSAFCVHLVRRVPTPTHIHFTCTQGHFHSWVPTLQLWHFVYIASQIHSMHTVTHAH